jgi:hypothetical protein
MKDSGMKEILTDDMVEWLDSLRDSGSVNMYGAVPLLRDEFSITKGQAMAALKQWMLEFNTRQEREH